MEDINPCAQSLTAAAGFAAGSGASFGAGFSSRRRHLFRSGFAEVGGALSKSFQKSRSLFSFFFAAFACKEGLHDRVRIWFSQTVLLCNVAKPRESGCNRRNRGNNKQHPTRAESGLANSLACATWPNLWSLNGGIDGIKTTTNNMLNHVDLQAFALPAWARRTVCCSSQANMSDTLPILCDAKPTASYSSRSATTAVSQQSSMSLAQT